MHKTVQLTYKFQKYDPRDFRYQCKKKVAETVCLDLSPIMPPVLNQGDIPSCVANPLSNLVSFCSKQDPSRLFIYYNARRLACLEDNPNATPCDLEAASKRNAELDLRIGCKAVVKFGHCSERRWGYQGDKVFVRPPELCYIDMYTYLGVHCELDSIKSCLQDGFPLLLGIEVYDSFMSDEVAISGEVVCVSLFLNDSGSNARFKQ